MQKINGPDLKTILNGEIAQIRAETDSFPIHLKEVYASWLAQTYYFVCHSTRLLALAASRFSRERNDLHCRFTDHIREERGHEFLALKDLKEIGCKIEDIPELPETQAFYQSQYYWIEHVNPISFFGYILCLEGFAMSGSVAVPRAIDCYGDQATSFMNLHTKEDVGHVDQAFRQLDALPMGDRELIVRNLRLSAHLYRQIYAGILASAKETAQKAA